MKSITTVAQYIANAPKDLQARLEALRAAIRSAAPGAQERISYGMPFYEYKGRLVYFQLWKKHIGLYGLAPDVEHASDVQGYITSKGTIRLPLNEKLPVALIKKLVKAKAKKNDAAENKK